MNVTNELDPEESRTQLLERVGRPVFIVDSESQIISGNAEALNIGLSPGSQISIAASPGEIAEINSDWLNRPEGTSRLERHCSIPTAHGEIDFVVRVEAWNKKHYVWCLCPGSPEENEPLLAGHDELRTRLEKHLDETDVGAAVFAISLQGLDELDDAVHQMVLERTISRAKTIANGAFVAVTGLNEIALVHGRRDVVIHAAMTAGMIRDALQLPYEINSQEIVLSTSIGVAIGWPALSTSEALLEDAESARITAEAHSENSIEVFDDSMRALQIRKIELADALKSALKANQIELQYQAIVNLPNENWISLEGYMRWIDREMGFIPPMDIIPAAERGDLIQALGRQVVNVACSDITEWRKTATSLPPIWINLSIRELLLPHFIEALKMQLSEHGVACEEIGFDVPVAALTEDPTTATEVIAELTNMGIAIALDDVNDVSIDYEILTELNVSAFKLDRNLLWEIHSPEGAETLQAIIRRGAELNAAVIAKGVETPEQRDALIRLGVAHAQGFLFARPQEVADIDISKFDSEQKSDVTNA